MSTLEADIVAILEQTKAEIQANLQAQRINASGRTSASMRVEQYNGGARLVGGREGQHSISNSPGIMGEDTAPIPTLEFGRGGGDVPRGFYYIIREWSKEKGLSFDSERERNTFAYFTARKIAREGTKRDKQHADVYSTPVERAKAEIDEIVKMNVQNQLTVNMSGIRGAFTA